MRHRRGGHCGHAAGAYGGHIAWLVRVDPLCRYQFQRGRARFGGAFGAGRGRRGAAWFDHLGQIAAVGVVFAFRSIGRTKGHIGLFRGHGGAQMGDRVAACGGFRFVHLVVGFRQQTVHIRAAVRVERWQAAALRGGFGGFGFGLCRGVGLDLGLYLFGVILGNINVEGFFLGRVFLRVFLGGLFFGRVVLIGDSFFGLLRRVGQRVGSGGG